MSILWLYIWITFLGPIKAEAQPICISSFFHNARLNDPSYDRANDGSELEYLKYCESGHFRGPTIFEIPIAVYVIEDPLGESIGPTNMDINAGIDLLNRVLDGQDPCTGNVSGISTGIRFCLATRDTNGASTSGIIRTSHALYNVDLCYQEGALKNLVRIQEDLFPNKDYVNLYIVSSITASCIPNGESVAGFAAYPAAHGTPLDGIVIESSILTSGNCDMFKVLLHETGHYFNLLHTYEGGCKNNDCLSDGDKVCDTPPDNDQDIYPSNPCLSGGTINSCNSDSNPGDPSNPFSTDQNDLTDNYMDYAPIPCAKYFTPGQVIRMHAAIEGPRRSLLVSPGCQAPCNDAPTYVLEINDDALQIGEELVIIPFGSNIHDDSYWTLSQEIFPGPELYWPADTSGTLTFIFHPFHPDPTCSTPDTVVIRVDCYLQPQLVISDLTPEAGDTLFLASPGSNEDGLTWYIDDQWAGQGDTLIWPVATEGSYQIRLEYCDATCCGNTVEYIQAGECPSGLEGNLWMFARDGITLDFSTGIPEEIIPVQPSSFSDEASSIVCDKNGNLLFYTNGEYVWDRYNTNLTPHGPQISQWLRGNRSSTNILTLPAPDHPYLYYIIYNSSMQGDPLGFGDDTTTLYYATIDMRLNGGLGEVVLRNMLLKRGMTEKIAATRHCNGRDWWLLSYQASTESFLAWLIDSEGIHSPVSSKVGVGLYENYISRAGEINFSPDGTMIATAFSYFESIPGSFGTVELFRFNPSSGVVYDPILLEYYDSSSEFSTTKFYGLEFSPNNRFLYANSFLRKPPQPSISTVSQFCLDQYHQDSIRNSKYHIFYASPPDGDGHHAIQTGRDGKIYLARYADSTLSIIHHPNLKRDECDFEHKGFFLKHGESFVGLPSFPNGINTPEKPYIRGPHEICDSVVNVKYYVAGNCTPHDQDWKVLGTSSILEIQGDTIWISPSAPGFDTLVVTRFTSCRTVTDSLIYEVKSCDTDLICSPDFQWIAADTLLCPGEGLRIQYSTNASIARISSESGQTIGAGDGSIYYQYPPPPQGNYLLYLWNSDGCDTTINFHVQYSPSIGFNWVEYDSVVCTGQIATLAFTSEADRVDMLSEQGDWLEMNPTQPFQVGPLLQDTSFQIRLRHSSWDCDSLVNFSIRVEDAVTINIDSLYLCPGDSILIWSSWINTAGEFDSLFQSANGCDSTSIIRIILNPSPAFKNVEVQNALCGDPGSIEINASSSLGPLDYAINNISFTEDSVFNSLPAGIYTLFIRDLSGCTSKDTIEIKSIDPPSIFDVLVKPSECGQSNGIIEIHAFSTNSSLEYSVGGLFLDDSIFTSLPGGTYQVAVRDTFGCIVEQQVVIGVLDGPQIIDIQATPEYCHLSNGAISIIATSSNGPLSYSINGAEFFVSPNFLNLQTGTYQVIVQDSNSCTVESWVQIDSVSRVRIDSLIVIDASCMMADGRIQVFADTIGVNGYSMDKMNFQVDPTFEGLSTDTYTIYLLSHNLCLDSATINVDQEEGPVIEKILTTEPFCANELGQIEIIGDGNAGLRYSIDGGLTWNLNSIFEKVVAGSYLVIITDQTGCVDSQFIILPSGGSPEFLNVEISPANCIKGGEIKVMAQGDQLEYFLNDTIKSTDGHFLNLPAGWFDLLVINGDSCVVDTTLEVTEKHCNIYVPNLFSPNGDGVNDLFGPQMSQGNYQINLFEVYDRWGTSVYRCFHTDYCQWDGMTFGKQSPSGVYAWRMIFADVDGKNKVLTGDVTLIR